MSNKIVVIDAGHGIDTAGKRSFDNSLFEWEFNRDIAKRMKTQLDKYKNITVVLTATTDKDTSLAERVKIAENNKADIFVSIHANAFGNDWNTANGWEIFVYSKSGEQLKLAQKIHDASIPYLGLTDRGVKADDGLYVLKKTTMPAVLIEHGFYTNQSEVKLLKDNAFREKCAIANTKGILEYLNITLDNNSPSVEIPNNKTPDIVNKIPILINNKKYVVNRIFKDDTNYIELRSFEQAGFKIGYDKIENLPSINCPHINSVTTPETGADMVHYLYDRFDVVEVNPMDLIVKRYNGNLNTVSDKNVINTGYFISQKVGGAFPVSISVNDGAFLKYSDTELANKVPHKRATGTLIVYKNGKVDIKAISHFTPTELADIKIAVGGLTILPTIRIKEEGFDITTSEDGKDYTDVIRATNRIVIGYNPTKNKIVFVAGVKFSAFEARNVLQKLGCNNGITCDAGGSAIMKINNKVVIPSDNRVEFSYITF